MPAYLDRLNEARLKDVADSRAVLDAAAADNRDLTPEETAQYEKFNADISSRGEQIDSIVKAEERAALAEAFRAPHQAVLAASGENRATLEWGEEFRSIGKEMRGDSHFIEARYSEGFTPRNVLLPAGSPESRAALVTSGDTVPVTFADFVAIYQRTLNPTYGLARVIRSSSGENLTIPRLTTDSTAYKPGEGTAITESEPTLSSVTLSVLAYKGLAYASQELVQDNAVGLEDLIAFSAGRSIGLLAGVDFTTGTHGFITDGTNAGTASTPGFVTSDDLITLFYSLAQPYRNSPRAAWQMSNSAIQAVRKFKSTTNEYIWEPSLAAGEPDTLLGRAVYENPAMAALASASKSVAFGDWSAYIIKEVVPMRVAASQDFLFSTDQVAYKTVWRAGGVLPDAIAIKYLVSAAT